MVMFQTKADHLCAPRKVFEVSYRVLTDWLDLSALLQPKTNPANTAPTSIRVEVTPRFSPNMQKTIKVRNHEIAQNSMMDCAFRHRWKIKLHEHTKESTHNTILANCKEFISITDS
jgi:hypothetical protein